MDRLFSELTLFVVNRILNDVRSIFLIHNHELGGLSPQNVLSRRNGFLFGLFAFILFECSFAKLA